MELTCPHCAARYRIAANAVPPEGREIVCAKCGERWHQRGSDAEKRAVADATVADMLSHAGPLGEGVPDVGEPLYLPAGPAADRESSPAWDGPEPRRGGLGSIGWVLLLLIVALAAAAGYALYTGMLKLPA